MLDLDYTFGHTFISCDSEKCNEEFDHEGVDGKPDLKGAIEEAKAAGWIVKYYDGEYLHFSSQVCKNSYFFAHENCIPVRPVLLGLQKKLVPYEKRRPDCIELSP